MRMLLCLVSLGVAGIAHAAAQLDPMASDAQPVTVRPAKPRAAAVDSSYLERQAAMKAAERRQWQRANLELYSSLLVSPELPTDRHTVRLKTAVPAAAMGEGMCMDPSRVHTRRADRVIVVEYPSVPCEKPLETAKTVELPIGRLPAGEYVVRLEVVPNDFDLSPVREKKFTVLAVGSTDRALAIAVEEGAADVATVLETAHPDQATLERALGLACLQNRDGAEDATMQLLLAAGAQPEADLLHRAAGHKSSGCVAWLLGRGADPNQDIAALPGLANRHSSFRGTPLAFAVRTNRPENAALLLAAGAEPNGRFDGIRSAYLESVVITEIQQRKNVREIRTMLEARGGALSIDQRAWLVAQKALGAAAVAAFAVICTLETLEDGSCMH